MENIVPSLKVFSLYVCFVCAGTCVAVCDANVKAPPPLSLYVWAQVRRQSSMSFLWCHLLFFKKNFCYRVSH